MEIMSSRGSRPPSIIEDTSSRRTSKRYKVCNHLGKGGFAAVYRVQSLDTNNIYAIKIINKSQLSSKEHRRKLISEIKLHQSVRHQHVVSFEKYFEDKQNVYILLELCSNGSLMSLAQRRKRITEWEVRYFMLELLEGLKYLHNKCIIHRDLKLGNLLLDDHMRLKICDFGLAARLSFDSERKTTICGTPNYTAPEILNQRKSGEGHSYEVDIWSVGVIMFTLLTGKPPFETTNIKETYRRIKKIRYQFPANSDSYVSKQAKQLISSIFTKNPAQRPNLMQISNHSFFQLATPKSLPVLILKQNPTYHDLFGQEAMTAPTATTTTTKPTLNLRPAANVLNKHRHSPDATDNEPNNSKPRAPLLSAGWKANQQYAGHHQYRKERNLLGTKLRNGQQLNNGESVPQSILKENSAEHNVLPLHSQNHAGVAATAVKTASHKLVARDEKHGESEPLNVVKNNKSNANKEESKDNFVAEQKDNSAEYRPTELADTESVKLSKADRDKFSLSVIKYIDYRKKYGLGYILSNGCTGIYFNDSTKIVLYENKRNALYVDMYNNKQYLSMDTYPPELQKKVTLLRHFADYLWKPGTTNMSNNKHGQNASNTTEINQLLSDLQLKMKSNDEQFEQEHDDKVYVKTAFSDQYCMLFKLSNNMVQVNFTDSSQIMVLSHTIQYKDKNGHKGLYSAKSLSDCTKKDLRKRCKYTQQLLESMGSRKRKNQ